MTIQRNDPWQDAADQASGMEGVLVRHNCKTGAATVDGAEVGPDFRMCLFLEVAFHGWLKFEDNQLVDKDLRRFANEAPDPRVRAKGDDGDDGEGEGDDTAVEKQVVRTVHIAPSFEILGKCRDPNGNSIKTWSATGNSFEASAVVTTDTLLAIDEIGMAGTREVFSALYTLANGQGKSRLNRDASMRATRAWRVMVASTGEVPVETKIAEDNGRKARAGQLVRMIDVPATERAFGAFDSAPDGDSRAVADKFKLAASTHYGTAGPEFVRRIIADGVDGDAIRELINGFAKANVPPGSDGQIERVAGRFGIIAAAGEMATEFGLTGWDKGAATDAASWAFSQWIEAQGGGAIEERQAIAQVRQIIEQYGDSRFQSLDDCDARPVNDRLGWRQNTTDGPEWYATPENFKTQICAGLNPQKVAKILSERGMLHKQKGQGYQCTRTVFGKDLKVYVLKSILEEGKSEP